jgi:uncharacterized membrane protein
MSQTMRTLALATSIGAGVSGGVFFGFSTFVMKALDRLPAGQAIAAMNSINKYAPNALFMTVLFGSAVAAVPVAVSAARHLDRPGSKLLVAGAVLVIAPVMITAAYHVPRNDALALVDPTAATAADTWSRFVGGWNAWNHARTLTSIAGALALAFGSRPS